MDPILIIFVLIWLILVLGIIYSTYHSNKQPIHDFGDDFIYDNETGLKLTLEEAEKGVLVDEVDMFCEKSEEQIMEFFKEKPIEAEFERVRKKAVIIGFERVIIDLDYWQNKLEGFISFSNVKHFYVQSAYKNSYNVILFFTEIQLEDIAQLVVIAYQKSDINWGRAIIRREKLTDKVHDFFNRIEVKFPYNKPFCNSFYIIASDKEQLLVNFGNNFINALSNMSNPIVELNEDEVIMFEYNNTTTENLEKLVQTISVL